MDFTGKQLLIALIIEHGLILFWLIKYHIPRLSKIESWVGTIGANQEVLAKHNKTMNGKLDTLLSERPH